MNAPYTASDLLKVIQYNLPEEEIQRRLDAKAGWIADEPVREARPSLFARVAGFIGLAAKSSPNREATSC
jgi:hypothetical protein